MQKKYTINTICEIIPLKTVTQPFLKTLMIQLKEWAQLFSEFTCHIGTD